MPPRAEPARWLHPAALLAAAALLFLLVLPGAGIRAALTPVVFAFVAFATGEALLRFDPSWWELPGWGRGVLAASLGGGLLAWVGQILLMTGFAPEATLLGLWCLPALVFVPYWAFRLLWLPGGWWSSDRGPSTSLPPAFLLWVGLLWLGLLWIAAAPPPVDHDSLVYHLALPEQWLLQGQATVRPELHYSAFPLAAEGVFAAALRAGGPSAAKLTAWLFLVQAGLATALVAWRLLPADIRENRGRWAPAAGLLLATVPAAGVAATVTYNDLFVAALLLLALEALLRRAEAGGLRPVVQAGLLVGVALSAKLTALVACPALTLAAGVLLWARGGLARALGHAALAAILALALAAPVWIRNALVLGDPWYPALAGWLEAGPWDQVSRAAVADARHGARTLAGLLRLPLDVFLRPGRFGAGANPGPLLALALPPALLALSFRGREGGRRRLAVALCAAALVLLWWATAMNGRYVLAGLGLLCALGLAPALLARRAWLGRAVAALLAAGALLGAWETVRFQQRVVLAPAADWYLGRTADQDYLAARRPHLAFFREARRKVLPSSAKVLLVGEARAWGLGRHAVWGSAYDPAPLTLLHRRALEARPVGGVGALRKVLDEEGITHILLNAAEGDRLDRDYGHFRELGGGSWKELVGALAPHGPSLADTTHGLYLLELDPPG